MRHINRVVLSGRLTADKDVLEKHFAKNLCKNLNLISPALPPIFGACAKDLNLFNENADIKAFEKVFSIEHNENL